jgi:hypothetical protein
MVSQVSPGKPIMGSSALPGGEQRDVCPGRVSETRIPLGHSVRDTEYPSVSWQASDGRETGRCVPYCLGRFEGIGLEAMSCSMCDILVHVGVDLRWGQ